LFYNAEDKKKELNQMGAFTKRWVIDKRRGRRQKISRLRQRYQAAKSDGDRAAILKKAHKVSPQMSVEQFLSPTKQESAGSTA